MEINVEGEKSENPGQEIFLTCWSQTGLEFSIRPVGEQKFKVLQSDVSAVDTCSGLSNRISVFCACDSAIFKLNWLMFLKRPEISMLLSMAKAENRGFQMRFFSASAELNAEVILRKE